MGINIYLIWVLGVIFKKLPFCKNVENAQKLDDSCTLAIARLCDNSDKVASLLCLNHHINWFSP